LETASLFSKLLLVPLPLVVLPPVGPLLPVVLLLEGLLLEPLAMPLLVALPLVGPLLLVVLLPVLLLLEELLLEPLAMLLLVTLLLEMPLLEPMEMG
jgi:hypothetical protein